MQKKEDLVSVIMPNYNSDAFISQAINSVLAQTYKNLELLIVDDASTDNSVAIIESCLKMDLRIRLFKNTSNIGVAQSRNIAIGKARGRWIAFLDSDDFWTANKLEDQIQFMKSNNCAISCTNYYAIHNQNVILFKNKKEKYEYKDILASNSIGCLTVVIDRNQIPTIEMPLDAEYREDMACWLDIIKDGHSVYVLSKPLAYYRLHKSVSSKKLKMAFYQWKLYRQHERLGLFVSLKYLCLTFVKRINKYRNIKL